jgi:hypothetical protein
MPRNASRRESGAESVLTPPDPFPALPAILASAQAAARGRPGQRRVVGFRSSRCASPSGCDRAVLGSYALSKLGFRDALPLHLLGELPRNRARQRLRFRGFAERAAELHPETELAGRRGRCRSPPDRREAGLAASRGPAQRRLPCGKNNRNLGEARKLPFILCWAQMYHKKYGASERGPASINPGRVPLPRRPPRP